MIASGKGVSRSVPRFAPCVELSPGADLTAGPSTWSWTDLTLLGGYVHDPTGITITRGRQNRNSQTGPSALGLTLLNTDGIWVPDNPLSPYYGLLDINTPIRVLIRPNTSSASDQFGRTVSSTWGSADVGGAWTNNGGAASDYSVSTSAGGQQLHTAANSSHQSTLASVSLIRVDVTARIRVNALSTGASQRAGIIFRYTDASNSKRADLVFDTAGGITAAVVSRVAGVESTIASELSSLSHSTSTWYRLRMQTGLTSARVKVWLDGTSEPATWLLDGADSVMLIGPVAGRVGLFSRRDVSNTNSNATFDFDGFSLVDGPIVRFVGFVDSWPTTWTDASERQSLAPITASGHLRRLASARTLRSATHRSLSTSDDLVAYWPMEDGSSSTVFASAVGGSPVVWSGTVSPGADSDVVGSEPLPTIGTTGRVQFPVPSYPASSAWTVQFLIKSTSIPASTAQVMSWSTPGGTIARWQLTVAAGSPDTMRLEGYNAAGAATFVDSSVSMTDGTSSAELFNDRQLFIRATGEQNGANIDLNWSAWYLPDDGSSVTDVSQSTSVAATIANVTLLSHDANSGWTVDHTLGHVAVNSTAAAVVASGAATSAASGYIGESTDSRLARLATEEHVAVIFGEILGTTSGDTDQTMGPQPAASLLDQFREIEATEAGVLFDGVQGQVTILPRSLRRNHAVNLTLDHDSAHLKAGHQSVWDDQLIRNDIQVTNRSGAVAGAADKPGQAVRGVYGDPVRINAQSDTDATQHAAWRLHLGKTPERRYPALTFELHNPRCTSLTDSWLACDIGSRVNVSNLPNMYSNVADLLIEGYTEHFNQSVWEVTLNCSPAAPWDTYTVEATGNRGRVDTAASSLLVGYDSSDTSLLVATTGADSAQWSTTAEPYDWHVSGERMTVTTMDATPTAFVAAGTAAHADNASIVPGLPAGTQEGDLLVVFAAIRSTSAAVGTPTGYTPLMADGNVALFGKYHSGSESAPTVPFTGGAAGDSTSAQMAAFRYVQMSVVYLAASSNAAAQDITIPNYYPPRHRTLGLWLGWKQDDWTSVGTTYTVEIGEPSTTLGSDQGIVWDYDIQALATERPGGFFAVTGGAAAISKGYVVALAGDVQSCTVTRAVNGVAKAQSAGTAVSLWKPGAVTL
jgi:hypothetical protein